MTQNPKPARDYLKLWLERHYQAEEAVPVVKKTIEIFDWQCKAIDQQPSDTKFIPLYIPSSGTNLNYEEIPKLLPLTPPTDMGSITKINTIGASGASGMYGNILLIGEIQGEIAFKYYTDQTTSYQLMQAAHNQTDEIERMLQRHKFSNTLCQYPIALKVYYSAKGNENNASAAALEMRTLLEKFKGDLFQKASTTLKENMTWDTMIERLCPEKKSSIGHAELITQKAKHANLIGPLSSTLKRREDKAPINIDDLWTMVIDHIYIVLNTISI